MPVSAWLFSTIIIASACVAYLAESVAWRLGLGLLCLAAIIVWLVVIWRSGSR